MAAEFDFEAAFGCSVPLLFRGQSGPAPEQKDQNDDQQQQADGNDPPGSLIYEPFGLVHQWGNPGNEPLTFLAFNINPEGVPAVVPETPAKP